jgi:hypothetical protein
MPKGEHLKGKGVKFGQGQDPTKGGRKKEHINQVWKLIIGTDNEEEREITLSKDEKYKLLERLFDLNLQQLQDIVGNANTPVFVVSIITAIFQDMDEGRTITMDKYWDRFYGRADSKMDITSKGEKIDGGINLAALDSETLNKLMELQEKLSETTKTDE